MTDSAQAGPGSCSNVAHFKNLNADQNVDPPKKAIVGTVGIMGTEAQPGLGEPRQLGLAFGNAVEVNRVERDFVRIRYASTSGLKTGWVLAEDLHCGEAPVRDSGAEQQLELKAFIHGDYNINEDRSVVWASPSRTEDLCRGNARHEGCTPISAFQIFFVADQTADRLLLTRQYSVLQGNDNLVGWVSKDSAQLWPTAIGLRARDVAPKGLKHACLYVTENAAREGRESTCQPMLFDPLWRTQPDRLLVLGRVSAEGERPTILEVAAPAPGEVIEGIEGVKDGKIQIRVKQGVATPSQIGSNNEAIRALAAFKNIDVHFVIDGTVSMEAALRAVKGSDGKPGIVERIQQSLLARKDESNFQFGFTIYGDRSDHEDNPFGTDGIGSEYYIESEQCDENLSDTTVATNRSEFRRTFEVVQTQKVVRRSDRFRDDDFAEFAYGGLSEGFDALQDCPNHGKVLVWIGDNGYSQAQQKIYGYQDAGSLTRLARSAKSVFEGNMQVFSIQMPRSEKYAGRNDYEKVYGLFKSQAQMLNGTFGARVDPNERIFTVGSGDEDRVADQVASNIISSATAIGQTAALTETVAAARQGEPIDDTIRRLQKKHRSVPIWVWDLYRERITGCSPEEEGCQEKNEIITSQRMFLRWDPNLFVADVLMPPRDFTFWRRIGSALAGESGSDGYRHGLVVALTKSIDDTLNIPYRDTNEDLGVFLERVMGVPKMFQTPLMAYSAEELLSESRVSDCELRLLRGYGVGSSRMLDAVYRNREPVYELGNIEDVKRNCRLGAKGERIPVLNFQFDRSMARLDPDDRQSPIPTFRYQPPASVLSQGGIGRSTALYWVPQFVLP